MFCVVCFFCLVAKSYNSDLWACFVTNFELAMLVFFVFPNIDLFIFEVVFVPEYEFSFWEFVQTQNLSCFGVCCQQ